MKLIIGFVMVASPIIAFLVGLGIYVYWAMPVVFVGVVAVVFVGISLIRST